MDLFTAPDCVALLGVTHIERLALVSGDHPTIVLVNYVVDNGRIVVRTDPGKKLTEVPLRCVALEIDGIDDAQAWSVVAQGAYEKSPPLSVPRTTSREPSRFPSHTRNQVALDRSRSHRTDGPMVPTRAHSGHDVHQFKVC